MIAAQVAAELYGRYLLDAVPLSVFERLVFPWRFADRNPMPRLRLFRWLP